MGCLLSTQKKGSEIFEEVSSYEGAERFNNRCPLPRPEDDTRHRLVIVFRGGIEEEIWLEIKRAIALGHYRSLFMRSGYDEKTPFQYFNKKIE